MQLIVLVSCKYNKKRSYKQLDMKEHQFSRTVVLKYDYDMYRQLERKKKVRWADFYSIANSKL